MEEIVYSLNLDLRKNTHQVLVMKEDDVNSRVIEAVITDNGKPYDLTNCVVNLKWRKPDNHIVYITAEKSDYATVRVVCSDQMLAVAGTAEAEFDITGTTAVASAGASTLKFMVSINETVVANSDIESSDEFGALQDIMGHISNESIHVPSGGTSGQVLTMGNDGKSTWSDASSGSTSGDYLEKENPSGTGSFSMNRKAGTTIGKNSVAEGYHCTASGSASHAEGWGSVANGDYGSHAEGYCTKANKAYSHAEGQSTTANGSMAHVEGCYTIASGTYQHVQGKYNVEDTKNEFAHIVGGGTSDTNRKNIHTIDWNGNAAFAGDVTYNGSQSLAEMIQNLCYCIGTFKDAEIASRSRDELGEVKIACIPYSECKDLTTDNKIAIKFTDGSVGIATVYNTKRIGEISTWLTGSLSYVNKDTIQGGTNTLAIASSGAYAIWDDILYDADGTVVQRIILEISSASGALATSYRII